MVKTRNLPPLLSFCALLVCILPHCRLRDWCGNLRKASGHVVCHLDQSASFRIFDSTFYFPHSAIPHFTHSRLGMFDSADCQGAMHISVVCRQAECSGPCPSSIGLHCTSSLLDIFVTFYTLFDKITMQPVPNRKCLKAWFKRLTVTGRCGIRSYHFNFQKEARYLDGQIWALKADSLTSPLIVTVTVTVIH